MIKTMKWLNEPPKWSVKNNKIFVKTGNRTDFWRKTFYDFTRDDGHFFYEEVVGDFTMEVTFTGNYETLYDQAGLMLRVDENNWVKTGIEYTDDDIHLSTVVTREFSDWSVQKLFNYIGELKLRLTRHKSTVRIQFFDQGQWNLIRLAYLDLPEMCQAGIMCCSPERKGFEVEFKDFAILEPISSKLHD